MWGRRTRTIDLGAGTKTDTEYQTERGVARLLPCFHPFSDVVKAGGRGTSRDRREAPLAVDVVGRDGRRKKQERAVQRERMTMITTARRCWRSKGKAKRKEGAGGK